MNPRIFYTRVDDAPFTTNEGRPYFIELDDGYHLIRIFPDGTCDRADGDLVARSTADEYVKLGHWKVVNVISWSADAVNQNKLAIRNDRTPQDLGDGYRAVPFSAVTLNGLFLPQLWTERNPSEWAVLAPGTNKALQGEDGRPFQYQSLEQAATDVGVLKTLEARGFVPKGERPDRLSQAATDLLQGLADLCKNTKPPLTEGELGYLLSRPEALNCLADYHSVQETMADGMDFTKAAVFHQKERERYSLLAVQAQEAINNGD